MARDIQRARERVAALIGAHPEEIIFTSCGTESDSAAIRSALEIKPTKRHIVTTRVEHAAVRGLCKWLGEHGYRVTELGVDNEGRLDLAEVEAALTPDTAVASVMHANKRDGRHLSRRAHRRDVQSPEHSLSHRRRTGRGQAAARPAAAAPLTCSA